MYVVFDIGGTKTRVSFSSDGSMFEDPVVYPTPDDPVSAAEKLAGIVRGWGAVSSAVGGVAATLSRDGSIINAPNLSKFVGYPFVSDLSEKLGVPVRLYNDGGLAGLAEARYGRGVGHSAVVYLTVGTGFGGARITDGMIDGGACNAEPGKQLITFDGEAHLAGRCVSGAAVMRETGKPPEDIRDPAFWREKTVLFSLAAHNAVVLWSPDVVVLGGSMIVTEGDGRVGISVEEVSQQLSERVTFRPVVPVYYTQFEDFGVLRGALSIAVQGADRVN